MSLNKNDLIIGTCEGLGTQGEGIVKVDGMTLFVPRLLVGERAQLRVLKTKGNVGYARVEELFTPAEVRERPKCGVFGKCGGCQLQHLRYRAQLAFKTDLVRDTLRKIGGITAEVAPCERSEKEYGYRNKLQLPIGQNGEKVAVGFYAERSHRIVPTDECPIHPDWAAKLIAAVKQFAEKCGLDGYDDETGEGQLRHIVVRELRGRYLVTLVTTEREIKGIDYFLRLLDGIFPEYSFYLNVHPTRTNVVFGEEFLLLKGKGFYECTDAGISFEAGPATFVQVNEGVRGKLYERIVSLVDKDEVVVDAYAGGGLLTAMLAKKCLRAYGIEIVKEASECAERLRERNGLGEKMIDLCGSVEDLLGGVLDREPNATLVLDPPRSGMERSVIDELLRRKPKKIIMVSCNPATLARDLGLLTGTLVDGEQGVLVKRENLTPFYQISLLQPFDMFPQTRHVETLVCLERKE